MDRQKVLAIRLKQKRKEKGLSQKNIADKIGITRQAISYYETCQNDPPTSVLCNIADLLKVDPNWLLGYESGRKIIEISHSKDFEVISKEM